MGIAEKYLTRVISNDNGRYGVYHVVFADGREDVLFQKMSLASYLAIRIHRWWLNALEMKWIVALAATSFSAGVLFTTIYLAYAEKVGG